jgi:hypothetical protein
MTTSRTRIVAALKWVRLLRRSSEAEGWELIKADASPPALGLSTYGSALEWLKESGFVETGNTGLVLATPWDDAPDSEVRRAMLRAAMRNAPPVWMRDSDLSILGEGELPEDALQLAETLEIPHSEVLQSIREVHGHIDLDLRHEIGAAGERELVRRLEVELPGATTHVALAHDGFGYDIAVRLANTFHLEVKTTTYTGRLTVHLSRNEYERSLVDSDWRMVVVGLDRDHAFGCVASVRAGVLTRAVPHDQAGGGKWEAVAIEISPSNLDAGLPFLGPSFASGGEAFMASLEVKSQAFGWMP